MLISEIVIGALAMAGTLWGAYFAHRKSTALIAYKLEQLEKKVDLHNQVVERVYDLEKHAGVVDEKIAVASAVARF